MIREYEPFVIRVGEQTEEVYPVSADFQGASWSGVLAVESPLLAQQEIQQAQRWLERGFIDRQYAQDFGSRMFRALFQGAIGKGFREAYERVAPEGGLRVVLNLPPALADLPWELMYDADGVHGFLARSTTAPLVRHFAGTPFPHQLPENGPLRILIITASPRDYAPVSSEQEAREIGASLTRRKMSAREALHLLRQHLLRPRSLPDLVRRLHRRSLVEIDLLPHATRQSVQAHLVQSRNADHGYHVVHFIGHGYAGGSGGYLLFETEDGEADPVQADEFAEMIAEPTVNLAVLNACETASTMSLFRGAAQATLRRGVPAVIGMQVPFLDRAAVEFAREFYGAWAASEPIEGALAYARRLIKKTTPGAAADWSIPVLYMGPVEEGLTLRLGTAPLRWPWPVRGLRWAIALLLSLLSTIALLLQVPDIARAVRMDVPIVRCAFPYPMSSGLSFNVAVAEFIVLDENGSPIGSKDGKALADLLFQQLDFDLNELDLGVPYEIRSPTQTCAFEGRTREEREEAAAGLAERINAHVIIYGVITRAGDRSQFAPEFYVNYKGFGGAEASEEITGQHALGSALRIALPIDAEQFQGVENPALSARIESLSLITIGLSYYATDNHETALDYFKQAEATEGWLQSAGKEIVYMLLGNASGRLASQTKSEEDLATPLDYYDTALSINPTYARAKVGRAGVLYAMAIGDLTVSSWDTVDRDRLDESEGTFKEALDLGDPPETAHIEIKVHFGLGQVYWLRAQVGEGDWMEQAAAEFEQVVDAYESGNSDIKNLAGHAYARLGAIARLQRNIESAVAHYTRATELVTPYYQAYYYTRLGEVHAAAGQIGPAIKAYTEAISIAEFYAYEESAIKYGTRLNELRATE